MINFVQATDHEVYMYAKFECLYVYEILKLNTPRFDL
jgi:hypothetical protein